MLMTWLVGCTACSFDPKGSPNGIVDAGIGPDAIVADARIGPDGPFMCVAHCEGATLVECSANVEQRNDCPVDCVEAGGPHCGDLVGSNDLDPDLLVGADGELRAMDGDIITIQADTGQISRGATLLRPAGEGLVNGIRYVQGPPYNVFVFDRLRIDRNGTVLLRAISTGGVTSPAIFYLSDRAEINGLIDITAGCPDSTRWCAGVGGGNGGTTTFLPLGCARGSEGSTGVLSDATGGGGGGFGQDGGAGGDSADFSGGAGGVNTTCTGEILVPLEGGSGGDRGGDGGRGGGGGGALQITALRSIEIAPAGGGVPAGVWAGGGGGEGGGIFSGGGGGGSGGAILLESPVVDVASGAILAANGGGGGEGDGSGNGQDGLLAAMPAGGGGGGVVRHGGPGGCCTTAPEVGDGPGGGTGGGGGGAGRIRINGRDVTVSGTSTPPPSVGPITVQ